MNFLANPILGAFLWVRILWTSLVAQTVKNLPAMQETQVRSLGQEDSLEKEILVFLTGESHGQRRPVGYSPWGPKSRT